MQIEITAPDVDDERHRRLRGDDVGEVLLRTDAHVHTAGLRRPRKLGDDKLETQLVGEQVVGPEGAVGF